MPSAAAGTRRGLRDSPLGKLALLAGVLLVALVVSRGCGGSADEISQEQAIAIAEREIAYRPDRVQVRLVRRGFQSRPFWAVSLATLDERGRLDRVTVVLVDAKTSEVEEVRTTDG